MESVYTSRVELGRHARGVRTAELPIDGTVRFGLHSEIADRFALDHGEAGVEPHAMTFDYLVAATAGCMIDHMGAALEARGFPATEELTASATGEVTKDDEDCLVISALHVAYQLNVGDLDEAERPKIERALKHHARDCPMYRTLRDVVRITASIEVRAAAGAAVMSVT